MAKEILFAHPDRDILHKQFAAFLIRYLRDLNKRGIISPLDEEKIEATDAITDIHCDRIVEFLAGERPFN